MNSEEMSSLNKEELTKYRLSEVCFLSLRGGLLYHSLPLDELLCLLDTEAVIYNLRDDIQCFAAKRAAVSRAADLIALVSTEKTNP